MIPRLLNAIRRNHALEHATVAVLLATSGPTRLAGRASTDGFVIIGDIEPATLEQAAREALRRLQAGQSGLAVTPLCGTNIATTAGLAALGATAVLARGRTRERLPNAFVAAMFGAMAGQPLGRLVQKYITTLADHADIEVVGTRTLFGKLHKVETRSTAR